VDVPDLRVGLELLDLLFGLALELGAVLAEGLELVDELVNDVPEPLVGELQLDRGLGVEDVVEEVHVVLEGGKAVLQGRGELGVDVPEGELIVEDEEHRVIVHQRGDLLL